MRVTNISKPFLLFKYPESPTALTSPSVFWDEYIAQHLSSNTIIGQLFLLFFFMLVPSLWIVS
jgi:hypothetical protein